MDQRPRVAAEPTPAWKTKAARWLAVPAILLASLAGARELQAPAKLEGQDSGLYQILVNVHLVVLSAVVSDRKGGVVSDLQAGDFEVYEDSKLQSIRLFKHEDIPVTVGLVVDHSGSMRRKMPEVLAAARTFVRFSSPADQMFVINFNDRVSLGLPEGIDFTDRADELTAAISHTPTVGKTTLYDAVIKARSRLEGGLHDKKVLIVISDGGDNASSHTLADVIKVAGQSSALIYTIGIFDDEDPDKNPGVLKRLAQATGGEAFFPVQLNATVAACEQIARDIRHQYTLGYVSSNMAKPGSHHVVKVVAHADGKGRLAVRTRSGYIEPETDSGQASK